MKKIFNYQIINHGKRNSWIIVYWKRVEEYYILINGAFQFLVP